jgi:hypothetical protein
MVKNVNSAISCRHGVNGRPPPFLLIPHKLRNNLLRLTYIKISPLNLLTLQSAKSEDETIEMQRMLEAYTSTRMSRRRSATNNVSAYNMLFIIICDTKDVNHTKQRPLKQLTSVRSINVQSFIKPIHQASYHVRNSLPMDPYPKLLKSNPHPSTLFPYHPFALILSSLLTSLSGFSFQVCNYLVKAF